MQRVYGYTLRDMQKHSNNIEVPQQGHGKNIPSVATSAASRTMQLDF